MTVHNVTVHPSILINIWGNIISVMDLQQVLSSIYGKAINWNRNLFTLFSGKDGNRLILRWVNDTQL